MKCDLDGSGQWHKSVINVIGTVQVCDSCRNHLNQELSGEIKEELKLNYDKCKEIITSWRFGQSHFGH